MPKPKSVIMKAKRKALRKTGLVPFSGYCLPETKDQIMTMAAKDRVEAGVPIAGHKEHPN